MAITVQYNPNAIVIGPAAYRAGLGQFAQEQQVQALREQQLAEQQRQFDISQQLRQRALDAEIEDSLYRRNLGDRQMRLNQYRVMQDASNARAALYRDRQAQREFNLLDNAVQMRFRAAMQQADQAAAQQQQAQEFQQRALLEQQQADAQQRNWMLQNAPAAMMGPDEIAASQELTAANNQALLAPSQAQMQRLQSGIMQGDPQAIQEGLRRGIVAFSPEQKTQIRQLQEAMGRIATNERMSPSERMQAERVIAEQLHSIRPMQVPPDQQPVDPIQQFSEQVVQIPDPGTGLTLGWQQEVRNGVSRWVLDGASEARLKAHLDVESTKQLEQWKKDNGIDISAGERPPMTLRQQAYTDGTAFNKIYDAAYKAVLATLPTDEVGNPTRAPTPEEIQKEIQARIEMQERLQGATVGGDLTTPPQETPPMVNGRALINSDAEAKRYKLPSGTPIINSQGRTGTYYQ